MTMANDDIEKSAGTSSIDISVEESQTDADSRRKDGEFVRGVSGFRHRIGDADFPVETGRYHLFVALNCPWCHRVTLARNVLGLQRAITMDVAFPGRTGEEHAAGPNWWEFSPERTATLTGQTLPECTLETATGRQLSLVKDIYLAEHSSEASVPILYDKKARRIVNNESAEIVRTLNQMARLMKQDDHKPIIDLYPEHLHEQIDGLNELIYTNINNGAYKAGFSSQQNIYAAAFEAYFDTLASLERQLASDNRPYLTGESFTEADLRLFPTLYRHDPVYYVRMKLNGARILDYPYLWRWLCRVYALPGVEQSNSLTHCRQGYFGRSWNNTIPLGPHHPMPYPQVYRHPELAGS